MPKSIDDKLELIRMMRTESASNLSSIDRRNNYLHTQVNNSPSEPSFFKEYIIKLIIRLVLAACILGAFYYFNNYCQNAELTNQVKEVLTLVIK